MSAMSLKLRWPVAVHSMLLLVAPGHIDTLRLEGAKLGTCSRPESAGNRTTINMLLFAVRAQHDLIVPHLKTQLHVADIFAVGSGSLSHHCQKQSFGIFESRQSEGIRMVYSVLVPEVGTEQLCFPL